MKTSLGEIATAKMGSTILAKDLTPDGIAVVSAGRENVVWGHTNKTVNEYAEGVIVISARGSIGFPKLPKVKIFACTQTTIAFAPREGFNPRFALNLLRNVDWAKLTSGASIPMLTISELNMLAAPLPPFPEQIRIADKLDALLSRVEAGRERLERVPGLLKRFRQSVLSAAVGGDEVEFQPLRDVVAEPLRNGKSVRDGDGGPVLRLSCLKADGVDWHETKSGDWTGLDFQRFVVCDGDFLISRGNGSLELVGRGALAAAPPEPTAFPDTLIRVRPNLSVLLPAYLNLIWRTEPVRQQIQAAAKTTAGIFKVSQGDLEKIGIPVPPLPEQAEIVRRVEALFTIADRIEARYQSALTTFNRMTPALLAKAFRGELVPQDPNDEPASELLERIRAARADAPKKAAAKKSGAGRKPEAAQANAGMQGEARRGRGRPPKVAAAPARTIPLAASEEDAIRLLQDRARENCEEKKTVQPGLFDPEPVG